MEQKTFFFWSWHQSDISLYSMQFPPCDYMHWGTSPEMQQVPQAIFSLQPEKHALIMVWKRWCQTSEMSFEFRPKSAAADQCRWGGSSADEHTKRWRWILTARVQWFADDMPSITSNQSGHGAWKWERGGCVSVCGEGGGDYWNEITSLSSHLKSLNFLTAFCKEISCFDYFTLNPYDKISTFLKKKKKKTLTRRLNISKDGQNSYWMYTTVKDHHHLATQLDRSQLIGQKPPCSPVSGRSGATTHSSRGGVEFPRQQ